MRNLKDWIIGLLSSGGIVALITGILSLVGDKLKDDKTTRIKELELENADLKEDIQRRDEAIDMLHEQLEFYKEMCTKE
ncbi:hypothetical protein FHQ08_03520 [Lactobacillus sp. CC-MHH1034]|uniref:hypothetical protein n=1 Tax=Agrilactobacillus fermenti TaxID=2586909 RepID=UPI001E3FD461|nr:hypothetical protein [Agrilactobacillus fermenti]MCD2255785.1 hypothetical protein [Agrilactobacillus fermenti]